VGGLFAALIRLELLTPRGDLVSSEVYNRAFTAHGAVMIFLFLTSIIGFRSISTVTSIIGFRSISSFR
ncbi:cbb3-type cytochrome c oxidase subunit I, partial [Anaerolineales bacterium HSG25]|nr:cbb3-type cytochrome c oxidase subunit I [Anaerolineales bacterium HSG25]